MVQYNYFIEDRQGVKTSFGTIKDIIIDNSIAKQSHNISIKEICDISHIAAMFSHGELVERSDSSIELENDLLEQYQEVKDTGMMAIAVWFKDDIFNTIRIMPIWDMPFYVLKRYTEDGDKIIVEVVEEDGQ